MANQTEVLRLLMATAPNYCSGDRLASELSISRTAVWKMIQGLQTTGYSIESRHGLGYRYVENNQLSVAGIQNGLKLSPAVQLSVLPSVDSTNAYLKRMATRTPLVEPVVVVADTQTAGYGRSGRTFYSPGQTGIYLSIGLPVTASQPLNAGLLTTSTAVVVAQTLQQLFNVSVELKWVNDVLVNHHKVVGIMSEGMTNLETGQISTVIVGMGINLTTADFPTAIQNKAGAVLTHPTAITRNQVVRTLLQNFFDRYPTYRTGNFMTTYRKLSMVINQRVALKSGAQTYDGVVEDIDQNGALVVQLTDGRVQHFSSGEITKVNLLTGQYHG